MRQLENGRFRFYGELKPAGTPGEMAGARLVREWDPATGATRTWYETLDQAGRTRIVHPKYNDLPHYVFDAEGRYVGTR
jgi:filamentous hemagglutinin